MIAGLVLRKFLCTALARHFRHFYIADDEINLVVAVFHHVQCFKPITGLQNLISLPPKRLGSKDANGILILDDEHAAVAG